ncbi:MAG: UDP-N-acetylglucosamine 1-carboxyvinyltransferase [Deltaproteobacteria bacterium CG_4_10_14_0_2_um_filter_43_8]|nr:MAG: UDP-N-acetylglucosamine 1-carboxyvinyltransferase [Deltaproteobacteria bacterium CG11_big_fil_rev_8_21_14_0_20_42_23]PJA21110.1 MAG: UDP-N-acetylglucosamine 1-carboxyvinyltransferase [Deltaproteobacteria bacterium CG_4_10_14_0_2_um_filter_43_8]PJC64943.1 MAG: UDP-N-acetylglucosamine 1-carboxyvinyltransferase [Deltaproteobacteria bacterium CG_4_9_14_0_2_um_filter_42_21]
MDSFLIEGGKKLEGEVNISGAKNAALPLLAASLLCEGTHSLENVPRLRDISTMLKLLSHLGVSSEQNGNGVKLNADKIVADDAPYELVKTMRASVLVMGPLVARLRHAKVSLPGGCAIGARPIDLHLKALEQMGAKVELHDGYVEVFAENLKAAHISFDKVTVTGTENIMMAACLLKGTTILENAAKEPEVVELAEHLCNMGAKIRGAGTHHIEIEGVEKLHAVHHRVMSDRIEAGTFVIAAAITGGKITLHNAPTENLSVFLDRIIDTGASVEKNKNDLTIIGASEIKSVNISTAPHPGFATDLQAQFMALMCKANGTSIINENIFENRFMHVPELKRMGADINIEGHTAIVNGKRKLTGAPIMATDLRASACLVLAALAADGQTEVSRIYHLDRGYDHMEEKLCALGANIIRKKNI